MQRGPAIWQTIVETDNALDAKYKLLWFTLKESYKNIHICVLFFSKCVFSFDILPLVISFCKSDMMILYFIVYGVR